MLRVRVQRVFGAAFVQRRFTTTPSTPPLPLAEQGKDLVAIKYHDAATWPKDLSETDVKELLKDHVVANTKLNFNTVAVLLKLGDINAINQLVQQSVSTPKEREVNVEEYLKEHVDNGLEFANMKLQERENVLANLESALSPTPGSEKRNVAFSYSQRGSGKTQFLKYFVATKRSDAMKCGRVIVRCCSKVMNKPWFLWTLEDRKLSTPAATTATSASNANPQPATTNHSTDDGLCELIRTHVEAVTGTTQDTKYYSDPQKAYATWISETARHFNIPPSAGGMDPLIVLDTCELLAEHVHKSRVHSKSAKPYTLLEAFCLSVPSPHCIFVTGCDAKVDATDPVLLTMANVTNIGPLPPLSEEGYKKALVESWDSTTDELVRESIFHWAGGLPRLLKMAHAEEPKKISLACGSLGGFARCFESYKSATAAKYPIDAELVSHAYTSLLASSTKTKVKLDDVIVLNPAWKGLKNSRLSLTYDKAMTRSIGTYNTKDCRFVVPPITFADEVVKNLAPPILPSQLHPFLNAEISSHFGKDKDVERGRIFEKAFVYAVYARYLLAHWETMEKWIPFTKVFDGAIDATQLAVIADYEVNFSKGVVEVQGNKFYDDAKSLFLTYLGGSSHHDAYIWCRTKSNKKEFAVPLQLRHGLQKDKKALTKQLRKYPARMDKSKIPAQKRASFDDPAPLLLSVNQKARKPKVGYEKTIMMIDAGAMSSISWLWLVAPDKEMA